MEEPIKEEDMMMDTNVNLSPQRHSAKSEKEIEEQKILDQIDRSHH